ncbi:hypothetical protein pb186bvf_009493 [Paramecium bursaria]
MKYSKFQMKDFINNFKVNQLLQTQEYVNVYKIKQSNQLQDSFYFQILFILFNMIYQCISIKEPVKFIEIRSNTISQFYL